MQARLFFRVLFCSAVAAAVGCASAQTPSAPDVSGPAPYLSAGGGIGNVLDHQKRVFGVIEYQPAWQIGPFGTWIAVHSTDREHYAAAGLLWHLRFGGRFFMVPSFGAGLYDEDEGLDLGYAVEFRSGLECGLELQKAGRISVAFWHISNGRLSDWNPGTEILAVRYALPLSRR